MTTYNINYTDSLKSPIQVTERNINTDFSIDFPGRIRLEWGEAINENLMGLLESFAVESSGIGTDTPDSGTSVGRLDNPVVGQLWFNKTNKRLYSYSSSGKWVPYSEKGQQYAANYGQIRHGEQLPLPVSPSGYAFSYDECIWSVSPFSYYIGFNGVQCHTNSTNSTVTMRYQNSIGEFINSIANYLIIGIQRNENLGSSIY